MMSVGRGTAAPASMKCSSQRNCNTLDLRLRQATLGGLNEVQFPKELQQREIS